MPNAFRMQLVRTCLYARLQPRWTEKPSVEPRSRSVGRPGGTRDIADVTLAGVGVTGLLRDHDEDLHLLSSSFPCYFPAPLHWQILRT